MPQQIVNLAFAGLAAISLVIPGNQLVAKEPAPPQLVKVFILAGQSNMEGQGVVDLDHEKYYNGGKGNLEHAMRAAANTNRYKHLKDKDGNWTERNDVWVWFKTEGRGHKIGPLGIGYTAYPGKHHIGPELQIGHRLGDHLDSQVLLIKTAWGGKSLFKDFRPPSSGGKVGPYYTRMMKQIQEALADLSKGSLNRSFNKGGGQHDYEIAGFFWMQGWNDMYDDSARATYEKNLINLINDVRKDLHRPVLPFVIGELGNGGKKASSKMLAIRRAQAAAADHFNAAGLANKGAVQFVPTTHCARPKYQSPNVSHGHHWYGNAESYFLIGDALGQAMVKLVSD